jgi:hypothetical protein
MLEISHVITSTYGVAFLIVFYSFCSAILSISIKHFQEWNKKMIEEAGK